MACYVGLRKSYRLQIRQLDAPCTETKVNMDLQAATRLSGQKWQLARIGALVFLLLACGLLVTSLLNPSKAGFQEEALTSRMMR